jgi:aminodeoxyfutalosine deaminase
MEYRKFKADYLFTGKNFLEENGVLVSNEKGKILDIIDESAAGQGVESFNGILSPGFINAHCHLELSHLKARIPEKTGLVDFVFKVVTERHFDQEEITDAIDEAEKEMLQCGIVAVGDICNNTLSLHQKRNNILHYKNFIEVSGWHPDVAEGRFEKSKLYYDQFIQKKQETYLVPHAPYSVSKNLWGKIAPYFSQNVVSIHNQETPDEDEFFLKGSGRLVDMYRKMNIDNSFYQAPQLRSLQTYFPNFEKASSVILVHNTFTQQQDIDYIKCIKSPGQLVSFCLCPNANFYIERKLPSVEMLLHNECNIVVGTDSLASNYQLNILEELKTISGNFPGIPLEKLLQWATINGAKALQADAVFGSFEKGKQPGIVLIENADGKKLTQHSIARRIL